MNLILALREGMPTCEQLKLQSGLAAIQRTGMVAQLGIAELT